MAEASNGGFLVLSQISKRYGGVRALENVDFDCGRGKIHAVLGENGAGKSTLIKIVAGVVQPDAGSIALDGRPRQFNSPSAATAAGVVCIFQELSLMPDLSVADNISIAAPPRRFGLIDSRAQRIRAEALLAHGGVELHGISRSAGGADLGRELAGLVQVRTCDLNVPADVERVLRQVQPEQIYHLAGYANATVTAGGKRLLQGAKGYDATIVSGQVIYRHGQHTGALPGKLIRGPQPAPVS